MGEGSHHHFEMPRLRAIVGHAWPRVVEGTIVPVVLFVVMLQVFGIDAAVVAGLVWAYVAVLRRVVTRQPVPGIIIVGAAAITAKSAITLVTSSTAVYFLQPTLGTAVIGAAFLLSVPLGAPLAARLARDFCPLPEQTMRNPHVRRFFVHISLLWAVAQLSIAAVGGWLVFTQSTSVIAVARPASSWGVTGIAIAISTWWFYASMRRHGLLGERSSHGQLRLAPRSSV
jgi:hypothetical protein